MKKLVYLLILLVPNVFRANAQESGKNDEYKVPAVYQFDYKVVYQVNDEENNKPETMTYYFTKDGDYMSMVTPESQQENEDFVVFTKDGKLVTFSDESGQDQSGSKKVLKVIDMRSMYSGLGKGLSALANSMAKKEKPDTEKPVNLDDFVKTGKTKQFFGYTATEYSKHVTGMDNGKERSGTAYVWYAKVNFDPEMMFSMGLGNLASQPAQSKMQHMHPNNMFGMAVAQKDYLLTEVDFVEDGGKSGTPMKVVSIEKTDFSKNTSGYNVENYSGMNLSQMIEKEREGK